MCIQELGNALCRSYVGCVLQRGYHSGSGGHCRVIRPLRGSLGHVGLQQSTQSPYNGNHWDKTNQPSLVTN